MTKLTDLQAVLLTHAAGRPSGSLYALPGSVTTDPARVMKAAVQLLRRGLLEEREVSEADAVHRTDHDLRYGAFITPAGLAAIGVDELPGGVDPAPAPPAPATRVSKTAIVLDQQPGRAARGLRRLHTQLGERGLVRLARPLRRWRAVRRHARAPGAAAAAGRHR